MDTKTAILFVCMGNICRSPLAEGIFGSVCESRGFGSRFHLDSAGTGGWHVGDRPDGRSVEVAKRYGIDISQQRCRKISIEDFERFDYIFGMDADNMVELRRVAPVRHASRLELFLDFAGFGTTEIPDPYYGGADGFENAYQSLLAGSQKIVDRIHKDQGSRS